MMGCLDASHMWCAIAFGLLSVAALVQAALSENLRPGVST